MVSIILYNAFVSLYTLGIRITALWNKKARLWIEGRKHFPSFPGNEKTIWMHCASLGEFEQGRPLLEKIRTAYPAYRIVLTFFSPSGYEIRKNYSGADAVFYLPADNQRNAERFINMINPDLVLWVKYEYWFHYLHTLRQKDIPVLLISGIFRESQPFFKSYGNLWRKMLDFFDQLFVQDEESLQLINTLAGAKSRVNGDTRFDRVVDIANMFQELPEVSRFCGKSKVIVAGSTWLEDETVLMHFAKVHPEIKIIIAPHEIDNENLEEVKKHFKKSVFYSQLMTLGDIDKNTNVLIIDNIGMLSKLYWYATLTYVGGGFNSSGIHNILEAAVYGKPVIFGPVYEKFREAREMIAKGAAFSIKNAPDLENLFNDFFTDHEKLSVSGNAAKEYVHNNTGATNRIMNYIEENRLLIS